MSDSAPAPTPPPQAPVRPPVDTTVIERLIRVETRLVKLMNHLGLDSEGNHKK